MLAVAWLALAGAASGPAAQTAEDRAITAWVSSVEAAAQRSEHEKSHHLRVQLAARARDAAAACLAQAPAAAACHYARALALGLEARARTGRASALLKQMLDSLAQAEAADPTFDEAGPERVRALVLTRAPGWPLGPGDAEEAVIAARRAVSLRPDYPPNWLALAEAQAKAGARSDSRESYQHARAAASALHASDARDEWLREADEGLQRK